MTQEGEFTGSPSMSAPPHLGLSACLAPHPEERRSIMTAISLSLGEDSPKGNPLPSPPAKYSQGVSSSTVPPLTEPNIQWAHLAQANPAHFIGTLNGTVLHNTGNNPPQVQAPLGSQPIKVHGPDPYGKGNINIQPRPEDLSASLINNGGFVPNVMGNTHASYPNCNSFDRNPLYSNANQNGAYSYLGMNQMYGNPNVNPNVAHMYSAVPQNLTVNPRSGLGVNGPPTATPFVTNEGLFNANDPNRLNWANYQSVPPPRVLSDVPPQVAMTPAEKEIKELREMVQKLMSKDGTNFQALNFQDMVILPQKFKMPELKRFNGIGCPTSHLKSYILAMKTRGATPQMMATNFSLTLEGPAQEWIMTLDTSTLVNWEKVSELFQGRYADNSKRGNDKKELRNFCMRKGETFTDFVKRWKDKVAQTLERPSKDEEVDMFLNNLKPFYFHKMVCGAYPDFDTLMGAGLRIEECLRLGTMKDDTLPSVNAIKTSKATSSSNKVGSTSNGQENKMRSKRNFDILPDTQGNIFRSLKEQGAAKPLEGWKPKTNPLPANWEHDKFCEYHNFSGHTTDDCWILKNYLQDLIDDGKLERGVQSSPHGTTQGAN